MYCFNCGKQIPDDSVFCQNCGARQNAPTAGNTADPQKAPYPPPGFTQPYTAPPVNNGTASANSDKKVIAVISVCIGVLLCVVIGLFITFKKTAPKTDTSSDNSAETSAASADSEENTTVSETQNTVSEEPAAPKPEEIDTSFDGLNTRLSGLQPVNIEYVSSDVSAYPAVKTYFTLTDTDGNTVTLDEPYTAIKEKVKGGELKERQVSSFEQLKGKQGISIDLVADKSGSMSDDLSSMQNIMGRFVDSLDYASGDKAELIAFDSYVMYMCTYTDNTALLHNGIYNMTTYGETALYDALYEAIYNSRNRSGPRCIIAFTDGADNQSHHTSAEVIDLANTYDVPIFIIGTYSGDASVYSEITSNTGGEYWYIDSIDDMGEILDRIYSKEKDMYCLEYVSDADADPYSTRQISCIFEDMTRGSKLDTEFTPTEVQEEKTHKSRYEVIVKKCSWTDANTDCIERGGHLVTITSEDEMDKICELAEDSDLSYVWMGGYTSVRSGKTYGHWITGEEFGYQAWFDGEPSRTDRDGVDEMYLMLWNIKGDWSWNDQRNDPAADYDYFGKNDNMGYICEYEDVS